MVPKVDRRTRVQRLETLDEDLEYTAKQLDRAVTATSQIRLVLETYRDRLSRQPMHRCPSVGSMPAARQT